MGGRVGGREGGREGEGGVVWHTCTDQYNPPSQRNPPLTNSFKQVVRFSVMSGYDIFSDLSHLCFLKYNRTNSS